jgi:hypothetical protein
VLAAVSIHFNLAFHPLCAPIAVACSCDSVDRCVYGSGILNFYIDGDTTATISMTLLELAGESYFNKAGDNSQNGNPGGAVDGGQ